MVAGYKLVEARRRSMGAQKISQLLTKAAGLFAARCTNPKSKPEDKHDQPAEALSESKEIADAYEQVKRDENEVGEYVREREASIRKGARRAGKRFRL